MTIESKRLILREMDIKDLPLFYEIFSDSETMKYYPKPFDKEKVSHWITWNLDNYKTYGYGLWTLVLKESNEVIGDCGLVQQIINGVKEMELAYHVHKDHWGLGYATEGAIATRNYAFTKLDQEKLISLIRPENRPSCRVAEKTGMVIDKEIMKFGSLHYVYECRRLS